MIRINKIIDSQKIRGRFKTPPYFLSIKRSLSFLSQLKGVPLNLPFGIFTT